MVAVASRPNDGSKVFDELYRYDNPHRLGEFRSGVLSNAGDEIAAPEFHQDWTFYS